MRPVEQARAWHREGLLTDEALAKLEARYANQAAGTVPTILFGGAGAVLAAAIISVAALADFSQTTTRAYMLAMGIVAGIAGILLWQRVAAKEAAEGLAVTTGAMLVPAGLMFLFEDPHFVAFPLVIGLLGAVAIALPARTAIVPTVGAAGMYFSWVMAANDLASDDVSISFWLGLTIAMTALAFVTQSRPAWQERHAILNLAAPIVLAAATVTWWAEVLQWHWQGSGELVVALFQLPVLAIAFARRDRPILMGSVLVLAVDAVVFGFDIGQLFLGIPMLLLVAGGLVWLAVWANRD